MEEDRCICSQEKGCKVDQNSPLYPMCLMAFVKNRWDESGFPIKDRDCHIIDLIERVKKEFDEKRKNKHLKEDAKVGFLMKVLTVNLKF